MHSRPFLLSLLGVLAAASSAFAFDEVHVAGRPVEKGDITAVSPLKVTLDKGGVTREFNVSEIRRIVFDQEPAELKTARRYAENGQLDMALEQLDEVDPEEIVSDLIQQEYNFYKAYCKALKALAGSADKQEALKEMGQFLTQGGDKSWHYFQAYEISGDLFTSMGDYQKAANAYGRLMQAKDDPALQMRARVLQGRSLMKQQRYDDALALFDEVLAAGSSDPSVDEQKTLALLGKATCLGATGKPQEGVEIAQKIIKDNSPSDTSLFAKAYNTLGFCYEKRGEDKQAILAYLHTHLMFYGDAESHAEALYKLSKLWMDVGRSDRAEKSRRLLRDSYPASVWNSVD